MPASSTRWFLVTCLSLLSLPACLATHADDVCQNVGDCEAQSNDWVNGCQAEGVELHTESTGSGCAAQFDDYYACADAHFTCPAATPVFPGCETRLSALETCLNAAEAMNSCGVLDTKEAACPPSPNAQPVGSGSSMTPSPACTLGGVCQAKCYLDSIADVCRPLPAELTAYATCASRCTI